MAKVYLASHFFNRGGYLETEALAEYLNFMLGDKIDLYVPHRAGINDKSGNDSNITAESIYELDIDKLIESDILIANLDGVEIDAGVAGEVMAAAMYNEMIQYTVGSEINIIGYTTDVRINAATNPLIDKIKSVDNNESLEIIENHKANHLYRNLMVIGACEKYGRVINGYAYNDNYMHDIYLALEGII